jgi:hypothetical protein
MSGKPAACRTPAQQSRTMLDHRRKPQQMDLFGSDQSSVVIGAPAWSDLPAETRGALTTLIARLILGHLDKGQADAQTEAGHDL